MIGFLSRGRLTTSCAAVIAALLYGCAAEEKAKPRIPTVSEADIGAADTALRSYLEEIRSGRYDIAMAQYDGDWRSVARNWFESGDTLSAPGFLQGACKGLLFCYLKPGRTVESTIVSPDTIRLTLELLELDGRRFEPPPHGGGNERDTLFGFSVVKARSGYRMLDLPVYRP